MIKYGSTVNRNEELIHALFLDKFNLEPETVFAYILFNTGSLWE